MAVDVVGLRIFQAKRLDYFGEERPFTPSARAIVIAATKYKLGVSDLEKIELVKVGSKEGILIQARA